MIDHWRAAYSDMNLNDIWLYYIAERISFETWLLGTMLFIMTDVGSFLNSVRISGKFFGRAESHIEILSRSEKSPEIRPGTKIPWAEIHVTLEKQKSTMIVKSFKQNFHYSEQTVEKLWKLSYPRTEILASLLVTILSLEFSVETAYTIEY